MTAVLCYIAYSTHQRQTNIVNPLQPQNGNTRAFLYFFFLNSFSVKHSKDWEAPTVPALQAHARATQSAAIIKFLNNGRFEIKWIAPSQLLNCLSPPMLNKTSDTSRMLIRFFWYVKDWTPHYILLSRSRFHDPLLKNWKEKTDLPSSK